MVVGMLVKSNFRSHSDFQIQSWVGMWVVSCSNPNLNLKLIIRVGGLVGWWVVGWSNLILYPTLALITAQLGFRIEVEADRLIIRVGGW